MLPLAQADDESMSSGDESDDVDLTEGSSCGSDVSEWIEGTLPNIVVFESGFTGFIFIEGDSAAYEHSLALRYSKVSRHYSLPTAKPSLWVNTRVVTLQVRYCVPTTI
jgi:hypothetical protein